MSDLVESYLERFRAALEAASVAEVEQALEDAGEYLQHELWTCRSERPELSEAEAFARVEQKFGDPQEIARAYREFTGSKSAFVRFWTKRRAWNYTPGWKLSCHGCGRSGDYDRSGPLVVRAFAWSWLNFKLGWCTECRRFRWLRLYRVT